MIGWTLPSILRVYGSIADKGSTPLTARAGPARQSHATGTVLWSRSAATIRSRWPIPIDEYRVDTPRLALSVRDHAGGEPALLALHGLASNARWWDLVADRLVPAHRVIAVDLPGSRPERPPRRRLRLRHRLPRSRGAARGAPPSGAGRRGRAQLGGHRRALVRGHVPGAGPRRHLHRRWCRRPQGVLRAELGDGRADHAPAGARRGSRRRCSAPG